MTKFNYLFFTPHSNHTFIQMNTTHGDSNTWLDKLCIPLETRQLMEQLISGKAWSFTTETITVDLTAVTNENRNDYSYKRKSLTLNYDIPYLDLEVAKKLCDLNELTEEERNEVNNAYWRMLLEVSNYVIMNTNWNRKAKRELLTYGDETIESLFSEAKLLDSTSLHYDHFDKDVEDYENKIPVLIKAFISNNPKLKEALTNLGLLLIYQAKHPHLFDESIREKLVRYLSHTLATLTYATMYLLTMMTLTLAPAITFILFLSAPLSLIGISMLLITAAIPIVGLLSLVLLSSSCINTEYSNLMGMEYDKCSKFFFGILETIFKCQTHEFEMTRVLQKGKNFQLVNEVNISKSSPEDGLTSSECAGKEENLSLSQRAVMQ